MRKHEIRNWIVAVALGAALTFAPTLSAGQSKGNPSTKTQTVAARDAAKPPQVASDEKASPGGPHEGIKVHGHWSIIVKNSDGSVASHNEFENSLYPSTGGFLLAGALSRSATIGFWGVLFDGPTGARPCVVSGAQTSCEIIEPNGPQLSAPQIFTNLTMQRTPTLDGIVLNGSSPSANGGQISVVETDVLFCDPSVLPSACWGFGAAARTLTSHTLATPITLQAGQIVQITVTITFS